MARAFAAEANGAAYPKVLKPSSCRAARTCCIRSRLKRSRETRVIELGQRPTNAEAAVQERSARHRSRQHQYARPRITPELSRAAKRVGLNELLGGLQQSRKPPTESYGSEGCRRNPLTSRGPILAAK